MECFEFHEIVHATGKCLFRRNDKRRWSESKYEGIKLLWFLPRIQKVHICVFSWLFKAANSNYISQNEWMNEDAFTLSVSLSVGSNTVESYVKYSNFQ